MVTRGKTDNNLYLLYTVAKTSTQPNYVSPETGTIRANLDYLVVCGQLTEISSLEALVWGAFGLRYDWHAAKPGTRGKFYELNALAPLGSTLSINTIGNGHTTEYRLVIPGKILQHIAPEKLHEFGGELLRMGARCTRFDWAIDDYERGIRIDDVHREAAEGRRHGYATYAYYQSGRRGEKENGETIYLGSFSSDRLLRIYDKNHESRGQFNCIRVESQNRNAIADNFFRDYFGCPDVAMAVRYASQRAIGGYRFVTETSEVLSRCKDLDWWADFVKRVGGQIRVAIPKVAPLLSEKISWIEQQVIGTIGLITRCQGFRNTFDWLKKICVQAVEKNKQKDDNFVSYYFDRRIVEQGELDYFSAVYDWHVDTTARPTKQGQINLFFDSLIRDIYLWLAHSYIATTPQTAGLYWLSKLTNLMLRLLLVELSSCLPVLLPLLPQNLKDSSLATSTPSTKITQPKNGDSISVRLPLRPLLLLLGLPSPPRITLVLTLALVSLRPG